MLKSVPDPTLADELEDYLNPMSNGGHYGPLIIAWRGNFPGIGVPWCGTAKHSTGRPIVLIPIREVDQATWEQCCMDRGISMTVYPGQRYFEVLTD